MNTPLNPRISALKPSATLAINLLSQQLLDEGRTVYRLGFGQSPFPVPEHVTDALREHAHQKAYLPTAGLPELREAVAAYLRRTERIDCEAAQIVVGPGTKELMFLLQLTLEAEVIIPAPSWVSYAPQAQIAGREVVWLQSDLDVSPGLSPQALDAHCSAAPGRPRLLVLNYPNNPTGDSYSAAELEALAAVARKHSLLILSDEIYSGLNFTGEHVSIARFYPEGTLVFNGLSKWCGAGGWRLGVMAFPREQATLQRALSALITETFSAVSSPIQYAAVTAFSEHPAMTDYLQKARSIMSAIMTHTAEQLRAVGVTVATPRGGFYLFPRFDVLMAEGKFSSSTELCQQLLEDTGVALLPGSEFGRPPEELSARLAAVDFNGAAALQALAGGEPDELFLQANCGHTIEAIAVLCDWLRQGASEQV